MRVLDASVTFYSAFPVAGTNFTDILLGYLSAFIDQMEQRMLFLCYVSIDIHTPLCSAVPRAPCNNHMMCPTSFSCFWDCDDNPVLYSCLLV